MRSPITLSTAVVSSKNEASAEELRNDAMPLGRPLRVAFVACGLGHINRGFETTTWNWFRTMAHTPGLDVRAFGGGKMLPAERIANLPRNGVFCRMLRRLRLIHDGCRVEQLSFSMGFVSTLLAWQPDVIWFQEYTLGRCLLRWKKWFGLRYRLLYCNGAPLGPDSYRDFDFIQHLEPQSLQDAIEAGMSPTKMTVFPHVLPPLRVATKAEGATWRHAQEIPEDAWVVLSVAAWNRHHKRIDYVLQEVAAMRDPSIHVLLCGQPEAETDDLKRLAHELLPGRVHWRTLPQSEMPLAYAASDAFVLASLTEAFGLVLIESAARALPTLSHVHAAGQYILEEPAWLADLSRTGELSRRLREWKAASGIAARGLQLKATVTHRFSAESLRPSFAAWLQRVAASAGNRERGLAQ